MVQTGTVRAKFYKTGMLQYISHLDLVRTLTRILVRCKIPAWYTEGFNPRLKLTFAMPLSIGTQSECEFFEIRLTEDFPLDEIKRRVNECLTDEMQITEVYESNLKFSEIGWAEYEITLVHPDFDEAYAEKLKKLYSEPLVITKKSKSGDKQIDIAPWIKLNSVKYSNGKTVINALLSASKDEYLNPEYLIKAAGLTFDDPFSEYYTVVRKEVFQKDGVTPFR